MTEYTFTFDKEHKNKFENILSRLDPEEFVVVSDITEIVAENKTKKFQTIMKMEPDAALTFRLGMKEVTIRRTRTEEELAAEEENNKRHTVKITVVVDK